jgi:hypothetical protein
MSGNNVPRTTRIFYHSPTSLGPQTLINNGGDWFYIARNNPGNVLSIARDGEGQITVPGFTVVRGSFASLTIYSTANPRIGCPIVYGYGEPPDLAGPRINAGWSSLPDIVIAAGASGLIGLNATGVVEYSLNVVTAGADVRLRTDVGPGGVQLTPGAVFHFEQYFGGGAGAGDHVVLFNNGGAPATVSVSYREFIDG